MNPEIQEKLREIKRSFRPLMNGVTSQSMREKGVVYHLNWGVAYTDLRKMADEYGKDYHLAIELWKENIRECKILATMIMPSEEISPEVVEIWMEQTPSQEIAEMLAFNLIQYLDFAPMLAFKWISSTNELCQVAGYSVLARLFMKGEVPDDRGVNETIDQAMSAMHDSSMPVRHAAYTCLNRLSMVSESYQRIVNSAIRQSGLEIFGSF